MFSTPLRGCGRGRENGLVAIQAGAKRRNARPRPLRLASPPLVPRSSKMKESCAASHAFSESSKCIHPKYFLNLRIQTGRAQNGPSRCGPGQCNTLSRPRWTRCRATSPSQEGTCRPEATLPDRSATLEVVKSRGSLHFTARLSPSGLKAESAIPAATMIFNSPAPCPLPSSPPPLTGRREARRPAAQDAGDPTAGETSRAVPQPIEASENARFSIVQQRIQRDQPAKA
jgi:hypothetical protein